jgi:hypothetical protein
LLVPHPVGFFCVWEVSVLTVMATLSKPLQLAKQGLNLWRKRRLSRAFVEAQGALGERMYAAGIDDGELGARISALDERLRWAEAVPGSTLALRAARHQLVLQLAAAALEDDGPLPGADAEYRRAREAQAALERHEREVGAGPVWRRWNGLTTKLKSCRVRFEAKAEAELVMKRNVSGPAAKIGAGSDGGSSIPEQVCLSQSDERNDTRRSLGTRRAVAEQRIHLPRGDSTVRLQGMGDCRKAG